MKKNILLFALIFTVLFSACKEDDSPTVLTADQEKQAIAESIKTQVVESVLGLSNDSQTRSASVFRTTMADSIVIDMSVAGPEGGSIDLYGKCKYVLDMNDTTGDILYAYDYDYSNTYNDFKYTEDGIATTLNGVLNVTVLFDMQLLAAQEDPIMSFDMGIKGSIDAVTSNGFDGTIVFDLVYLINNDGTGTITGTIDGESYNEVF